MPESEELTLEADVVIVGSGAGGGVIAGELSAAGRRVCVLEMGGYHDESEFNGLELWAYQNLFLNQGPFPTADGNVSIQAGGSLGGGTVLNWTNCLRTTDRVRAQWAGEHGLEGLDPPDYDAHMDAVWERISVNGECSDLNGPHSRLKEGCEALGFDWTTVTRNTDPATYDPVTAGFMGFGDQSGLEALDPEDLPRRRRRARRRLRRPLPGRADPGRERPRRRGRGDLRRPRGRTARVIVRAPQVVVACGSIESPALLLRSGIGGPAVGDYLRLHPTSVIFGTYAEPQDPWWGPPQAGLSHEFADLDEGYGFLLECPQHTTGLTAAATPWRSGFEHKEAMSKFARGAGFINLTRDRGHGRVTIDDAGRAVATLPDHRRARHRPHPARLRRGDPASTTPPAPRRCRRSAAGRRSGGAATTSRSSPAPSARSRSSRAEKVGMFSAHQMGTCRMGADPATSVAEPARRAARHARASGSATRAPSRPPRGPTRCSR